MEEETRYCDFCGNELDEDEGTWIGDELLCDECCDDHTITCDRCGEAIWTQDSEDDDHTFLCRSCQKQVKKMTYTFSHITAIFDRFHSSSL